MLSGTTANPARPSAEATRPVTPVQMALHPPQSQGSWLLPPKRQARLSALPITALSAPRRRAWFSRHTHSCHPLGDAPRHQGSLGSRPVCPAWLPLSWFVLVFITGFYRRDFQAGPRSVSFQGQISSCYAHAHAHAQPMREAPAVPLDARGGRGPSVGHLCWLARLLRHRATH